MIKHNLFQKKQNGYVEVYISTLVCIFFLLVFAFLCIKPVEKLGIYTQLEIIERAALYRCEADGGLTDETKQLILDTASEHGMDEDKIKIDYDGPSADEYKSVTTFGEPITLTITYTYTYKQTTLQGFTLKSGDEVSDDISVTATTTSKQ